MTMHGIVTITIFFFGSSGEFIVADEACNVPGIYLFLHVQERKKKSSVRVLRCPRAILVDQAQIQRTGRHFESPVAAACRCSIKSSRNSAEWQLKR